MTLFMKKEPLLMVSQLKFTMLGILFNKLCPLFLIRLSKKYGSSQGNTSWYFCDFFLLMNKNFYLPLEISSFALLYTVFLAL